MKTFTALAECPFHQNSLSALPLIKITSSFSFFNIEQLMLLQPPWAEEPAQPGPALPVIPAPPSLQRAVKQEQKQPEHLRGLSVINSFWQAELSRQVFFHLN